MFSFCRSEHWNEQGRCFVETVDIVRTLQNLASPSLGSICSENQQSRTIRVSKMELLCLWISAPRSKAQGNRTKGAWFVFPRQDYGGCLAGQAQESKETSVSEWSWASHPPSQISDCTVWMIWHSTTESFYWAPVICSLRRLVENTQKSETSGLYFHVYHLIGERRLTYKEQWTYQAEVCPGPQAPSVGNPKRRDGYW